jgi:hypothetical protein
VTEDEMRKMDFVVRHSGADADALVSELLRVQVTYGESLVFLQQRLIRGFLWANGNNQSLAAEKMGVHRNTLHRLMLHAGIDPKHLESKKWRPRARKALTLLAELRAESEPPAGELKEEHRRMIREGAGV